MGHRLQICAVFFEGRPDSSVSSASDRHAKGGEFEPHCWQVDSAFHPSMGQ